MKKGLNPLADKITDALQGKASEFAKKILTAGVGTFFLTEDALKKLLAEMKLPKELLSGILDSANKSKNEFIQNFTNEVLSRVLENLEPQALAEEILRNNDFKFEVKVSVTPKKK